MIDRVISDTEDALRAVAKLVEPCRVDKATKNGIRLGHRVLWVFRDNPSVRDKHQKLQVCHQSLTIVFNCLYSKDVVVIAPAPEGRNEEQPPPYDPQLKELLDWQNRRKGRKGPADKEDHTNKSVGLTNENSNDISVAGPLSPCLLAIPLEDDGGTPSLFTQFSEMSFELPIPPTPEAQPSIPRNNGTLRSPTTSVPESNCRSPYTSALDSSSCDEIRSAIPNAHNNYTSTTHNLPEIDSPPLATMIAPYNFNNDEEDGFRFNDEIPAHEPFSAWDQEVSSPPATTSVTPWNTTASPTLPFTAVIPTSSNLSDGYDLGLRWLESARQDSCEHQAPTETLIPGQHPLPARFNSDSQLGATYQSDRLDAMARAEDVMTRESSGVSVGHGVVKRGGRSWLAYHATRSDMGHGMD